MDSLPVILIEPNLCLTVASSTTWPALGAVLPWLLVAAALAAAATAAWSLARRRAGGTSRQGGTFRRLARAIGLNRRERRVLSRLARRAGLTTPTAVLVSRGCFDHASDPRTGGPIDVDEIRALRAAIFGREAGAGPPSGRV